MTAAICIAVGKLQTNELTLQVEGDKNARVIAALTLVDVVVGVDGLFGAKLATKDLNSTIRDHLQLMVELSSRFTSGTMLTSLAFMLLWVPLPVWNTTKGKWSTNFPEMT